MNQRHGHPSFKSNTREAAVPEQRAPGGMKVGVIDYGVGNLGSVLRSLEELRVTVTLIDRAQDLGRAECLILPGVGNFSDCAQLLQAGGWVSALRDEVLGQQRPLLGV